MSKTALNDLIYNFEPLELFEPDSNYKVDEVELEKSIQKNKELVSFARKYIEQMEKH